MVAAAAYNIVAYTVLRNGDKRINGTTFRAEKDANGNWIAGHHCCIWYIDTKAIYSAPNSSYAKNMHEAILEGVRICGGSVSALPTTPQSTQYKRGSKGAAVKEIQTLLNAHGATPKLVVDGDFGALTETAVKNFQALHGLRIDGIVGDLTNNMLHTKTPQSTTIITAVNPAVLLSLDEIAAQVIAGRWGNDPVRTQKLTAAGYNAAEVQTWVRQLLGVQ